MAITTEIAVRPINNQRANLLEARRKVTQIHSKQMYILSEEGVDKSIHFLDRASFLRGIDRILLSLNTDSHKTNY